MTKLKTTFFLTLLIFLLSETIFNQVNAQIKNTDVPFVGAQVFIEPGQSSEDIDTWFRVLKENNFTVCRIRMFESYMRDDKNNWDFSLFDEAFKAADKYGIKVYATFFPYTEKTDIGGFKFPRNEEHLQSIVVYIEKLVTHFSQFESLFGWVLINEPGTGGTIPENEFAAQKLKEWKAEFPPKDFTPKGYPVLVDFTSESFLLDYNTWFLNWIALEIKKYDTNHDVHVNNHAIFNNCAEYDFPAWRKFLTSLGGSAHPSWHFGYFERQKYTLAMSANSEMILSGAGSLPWIMTEVQGGNNTYSGGNPFCPTKEEIAQWLWINFASQSKGAIFWSLNPRSSGIEAGEWALLNFQDKPSDRMVEAAEVAHTVQKNSELFASAKKVDSHINIIYVRESLWAEKKMTIYPSPYQARNPGGVMKSALGYFEALTEMGVAPSFGELREFNFSKSNYKGETIILSHQIAFPEMYVDSLENFVQNGGKLIVDGLTAFFDENMHNTMKTGFDLQNLFGGNISEFKSVNDIFQLNINGWELPSHLWNGFIVPSTGKPTGDGNSEVEAVALRNKFGKGEVLWIPSLIGLGSRMTGDYSQLIKLLGTELEESLLEVPVKFKTPQKNLVIKTLKSGSNYLTVLINKNDKSLLKELDFNIKNTNSKVLFANKNGKVNGKTITIEPEETMVILWN